MCGRLMPVRGIMVHPQVLAVYPPLHATRGRVRAQAGARRRTTRLPRLPMKANHESSFFFELFNLNIWTFFAHVLKLASDVTYGMQKELFKFLLVTVVGAILAELRSALSTPKLPALPPSNLAEWQQAQLAAKQLQRANLARRRMRDAIAIVLGLWLAGCSVSALISLSPPLPPPPPPPPPPLLVVVRRVTASRALQAVRYCRAHWVELVLVSSSLLLADWLNVLVTPRVDKKAGTFSGLLFSGSGRVAGGTLPAHTALFRSFSTQVTIDRLDPFVRVAQGVLRQAARVGQVLSRGVRTYRQLTQQQAADAASIGRARAVDLSRGVVRPR